MFSYYLRLGLSSLRRNPLLTALMVLTLGVGVAASMSTFAVMRAMSGDPIAHKSDRLLVVQVDNSPAGERNDRGEPSDHLSWLDAKALLANGDGLRRSAMYGVGTVAEPPDSDARLRVQGLAVGADFFAMFEVPFDSGGGWTAEDDERAANRVVITRALAQKSFGAQPAVGRSLRLFDREYEVSGVIGDWQPQPRYYWLEAGNGNLFGEIEDLFFPLNNALSIEESPQGNVSCSGEGPTEPGYRGLLDSECVFMQFWVELADAGDRDAYADRLSGHVASQKQLGRLPLGERSRLLDVREWMVAQRVLGDDTRLQVLLAFAFLLVCIVNTVGLLLAKFSQHSGEIGVRRALGATRGQVFQQYLMQAGVVGIVGGLLGVGLTFVGLWLVGQQSADIAQAARMNPTTLLLTLATAVAAAVLAGLLPTWRACQVTPAVQLKTQ